MRSKVKQCDNKRLEVKSSCFKESPVTSWYLTYQLHRNSIKFDTHSFLSFPRIIVIYHIKTLIFNNSPNVTLTAISQIFFRQLISLALQSSVSELQTHLQKKCTEGLQNGQPGPKVKRTQCAVYAYLPRGTNFHCLSSTIHVG